MPPTVGDAVGAGVPSLAPTADSPIPDPPSSRVGVIASGLSRALPVAAGLSAGTGAFAGAEPIAGAGLAGSAPGVGWPVGVGCDGVVVDTVGVDVVVLDVVSLGDGLPDCDVEPLGVGVPVGGPLGVPDAVGVQLGADGPVEPLLPGLLWPAGVVPPPVVLG